MTEHETALVKELREEKSMSCCDQAAICAMVSKSTPGFPLFTRSLNKLHQIARSTRRAAGYHTAALAVCGETETTPAR